MEHGRRVTRGAAPKHVGRPGPWAQLPMRFLGMLFVAGVLLSGYQAQPQSDVGPPTGDFTRIENPVAQR